MGASSFYNQVKHLNKPHFLVGSRGLLMNLVGRRLYKKAFISRPIKCFWNSLEVNMVEAAGIEAALNFTKVVFKKLCHLF
jgi:hypothetical protein